jgi:hypothetical protein
MFRSPLKGTNMCTRRSLLAVVCGLFAVVLIAVMALSDRYMNSLRTLVERSAGGEPYGWKTSEERYPLWPFETGKAEAYVSSHPDWTAYHILRALHDHYPLSYDRIPVSTKAAVLCSALARTTAHNDWGYLEPDGSWENVSGRALLALGPPAVQYLRPLLDDCAPAELDGSKEATISHRYQYRVADFAYNYICLIEGWPRTFDPEPKERDKEIENLKVRLDIVLKASNGSSGSEKSEKE